MESVLLATSVAAVTEFLKRINDKEYRGALIIAVAGAIGAVAGLLSFQGLDLTTGVLTGLGVAGIHTIAKQVG